jgi:hypothetical protein
MEITDAQIEEGLRRARAGEDLLGHRPCHDGSRCEDCGRPDWEAIGNCLARVRAAAHPLGRFAVHLDTMEAAVVDLVRSRVAVGAGVVDAIRDAREILAAQGVTAEAHRAWAEEERRKRERERAQARGRSRRP